MPVQFLLLVFVAIGLLGCGGTVQKTADTGQDQQAPAAVAPATLPAEPEKPAAVASLPAPPRTPDFSPEERDPSRLLALGRGDLSSILGKPAFIRREMAAVVWQYRTEACVLDLFLYELNHALAVTYYEFRPRRDAELARDDCFVSLLQRGISRAAQS